MAKMKRFKVSPVVRLLQMRRFSPKIPFKDLRRFSLYVWKGVVFIKLSKKKVQVVDILEGGPGDKNSLQVNLGEVYKSPLKSKKVQPLLDALLKIEVPTIPIGGGCLLSNLGRKKVMKLPHKSYS